MKYNRMIMYDGHLTHGGWFDDDDAGSSFRRYWRITQPYVLLNSDRVRVYDDQVAPEAEY